MVMVKDLVGEFYSNRSAVSEMLVGGRHGIIGYLVSATLYAIVSRTPFTAPMETILNIPPTTTHSQLTTCERKNKEKIRVFLKFQHFRVALK